jgi:Spy/CpxP family protein refolding chaperone
VEIKVKEKFFVIAAFVLTFAAGVLTGAIVVRQFGGPLSMRPRMAHEPGRPPRGFMLEMLKPRLNLDETQSQEVAQIVATYEEKLRQHFSQMRPQSSQIIRQMAAEIDSVLTPEQRQKFHEQFPPLWKMPHRPRRTLGDSMKARF